MVAVVVAVTSPLALPTMRRVEAGVLHGIGPEAANLFFDDYLLGFGLAVRAYGFLPYLPATPTKRVSKHLFGVNAVAPHGYLALVAYRTCYQHFSPPFLRGVDVVKCEAHPLQGER